MRVVFFGSPDFAVASLEALLNSKHTVVGVITQPDRPAGRGMKLEAPAVKKLALQHGLPIFQPEKVNSEACLLWLKERNPEQLVVVAYGEFLGSKLLSFCQNPPINVHPSLLPDLRGAAPMQWAVLRGYKETGVSTQFMVKTMDAGDVLLTTRESIGENESAGELQERLKRVGGALLVKTLDALAAGQLKPRKQDESKVTHAPLLEKEMGNILWTEKTAREVHCLVRGLSPWPGAFSFAAGKRVKILKTKIPDETPFQEAKMRPGEFYVSQNSLFAKCRDACIEILELQPEGKRPLLPRDFVNGMNAAEAAAQVFHPSPAGGS